MAKKKSSKKPKKIKIELTPFSLFLWSLFFLFLLAWVFVLGILAGRGLLPGSMSGLENPFKKLKAATDQKEEYEYKRPEEDPAFVFYDNLESKKNEVKRRTIPQRKKDPPQEITLSRDDTAISPEKPKSGGSTGEKQKEALPEVALQEYFSVQIASISNIERAKNLVKELVDQDYDAYYYTAVVNGKRTFRIMCGRFQKRGDAAECLNRLKRDTVYKRGYIVKVDK
ncbi:MAG: SPOR domain-containing protein [Desulfobacteraceae bacterium]|jgi:cell division septation protein DedD